MVIICCRFCGGKRFDINFFNTVVDAKPMSIDAMKLDRRTKCLSCLQPEMFLGFVIFYIMYFGHQLIIMSQVGVNR